MTSFLDRRTRALILVPWVALGACVGLGVARLLLASWPTAASTEHVPPAVTYAGIVLGALASAACLAGRVGQGLTLSGVGVCCCAAGLFPASLAHQVYYLIIPASVLGACTLAYRHLRLEDRWGCVRLICGVGAFVLVVVTGLGLILLRGLAIGGGVLLIVHGVRWAHGGSREPSTPAGPHGPDEVRTAAGV